MLMQLQFIGRRDQTPGIAMPSENNSGLLAGAFGHAPGLRNSRPVFEDPVADENCPAKPDVKPAMCPAQVIAPTCHGTNSLSP